MAGRPTGFAAASFVPRWGRDVLAGFVNAVVCVPNGLAMGSLAGVSPVSGLYAATVGPLTGSALSSTHLMIVTTTSAGAIAAGQAVSGVPEEQRGPAVFLMAVLTGLALIAFALLKAGRLVRYIPYSVMQGFMFGVAAILVLNQFPAMVGYQPRSEGSISAVAETLTHLGSWELQGTAVGLAALVLVAVVARTRISNWSNVIALVVPTAAALLLGWTAQQQVGDVSPIPAGLPPLSLPDLSLISAEIVVGALSIAAIMTVQASGISTSLSNPDGSRQDLDQDILAQGGANVAVGLLSGIPVGASVGQSMFNRSAGAGTRMALVFCGAWMIAFLLVLGSLIEMIPMAVLGALMVFAGFGAMDFRRVASIARTGWLPLLAVTLTAVMTVLVSVQSAVLTGVVLSFILNAVQRAGDVMVHAVRIDDEGRLFEEDPPQSLAEESVNVLVVRGDLFFAGAKTLHERLPSAHDVHRPAVVLRMRGQGVSGATLVDVLATYADEVQENGGRVLLSGLSDDLRRQLERSDRLGSLFDDDGALAAVHARDDEFGHSTVEAIQEARRWLAHETGRGHGEPHRFALRMVPVDDEGRLLTGDEVQESPRELRADLAGGDGPSQHQQSHD